MRAKEETMAHAAIPFTHQGGFTGEGITNIIRSAVDHTSDFEQLRFMQEDLKAEKDRLQLLLDLATQFAPDMELCWPNLVFYRRNDYRGSSAGANDVGQSRRTPSRYFK